MKYIKNFNLYEIKSVEQLHEDIKVIKDSMENCCKLTVPSKVDVEIGDNWGDAK